MLSGHVSRVSYCFLCVYQESEGQGCPFCRCEIKGTEPIVVDPFHPKASGASFAGFQGSSRAEAAGNDEEEDDRLEEHLVMSRLACSKVRGLHTNIRLTKTDLTSHCRTGLHRILFIVGNFKSHSFMPFVISICCVLSVYRLSALHPQCLSCLQCPPGWTSYSKDPPAPTVHRVREPQLR